MKVKITHTLRGFELIEFLDDNGQECRLSQSSSAEAYKIWLGVTENRMHLTQQQVSDLIPHLRQFVQTGSLDFDDPRDYCYAVESVIDLIKEIAAKATLEQLDDDYRLMCQRLVERLAGCDE